MIYTYSRRLKVPIDNLGCTEKGKPSVRVGHKATGPTKVGREATDPVKAGWPGCQIDKKIGHA